MRYLLILLAALLLPSAAQAEWFEASSAHFVVYADDSERDVQKFSEQLERFHAAMEIVTGLEVQAPSPSNRVTVFVVRSYQQFGRLTGNRYIGGFYSPRAGSSAAFVPRIEVRTGQPDFSMIALLHEYAHHFLLSNSSFPSPRWFGEGGAEFFASTEFYADGGLGIGMPAQHRGPELLMAHNVRAEDLVDSAYRWRPSSNNSFYGKSWLLYHYLVFNPERRGQLRGYLAALAGGKSSLEAAQATFGDLGQLERDLQKYLDQRTMLSMRFRADQLEIAPITVRRLSAGEAAMMPVRIISKRGVDREEALELLDDAREVAARFPGDAPVLAALAEAEYDAGNDAEAIAAADAALALDPSQVNAYVQKGYALFRRAAEAGAEDKVAAYRAAVEPFVALNKLENDHPLPLIYYFRSFAESGRRPSETAVLGLERAAELAPFDLALRMNLATLQLSEGRVEQARANLLPIAYNPHGDAMAEGARIVIERIDAGTPPDARELAQIMSSASAPEAGTGGDE
jgi:tetratricopeptide (TPR) repeat protein